MSPAIVRRVQDSLQVAEASIAALRSQLRESDDEREAQGARMREDLQQERGTNAVSNAPARCRVRRGSSPRHLHGRD